MTDFAREILLIAQRVVAERADGRQVDPARLTWAHDVIRQHAQAGSPPPDIGEHPLQIRRRIGEWEARYVSADARQAGPFDGLAA